MKKYSGYDVLPIWFIGEGIKWFSVFPLRSIRRRRTDIASQAMILGGGYVVSRGDCASGGGTAVRLVHPLTKLILNYIIRFCLDYITPSSAINNGGELLSEQLPDECTVFLPIHCDV